MPGLTDTTLALTAVMALGTAVGYLVRRLRKAARVLDVIERVVQRELNHNHGGSVKDDTAGTALAVGRLARTVDNLVHRVSDLEHTRAIHHPDEQEQ